jgi:hypothetical protein
MMRSMGFGVSKGKSGTKLTSCPRRQPQTSCIVRGEGCSKADGRKEASKVTIRGEGSAEGARQQCGGLMLQYLCSSGRRSGTSAFHRAMMLSEGSHSRVWGWRATASAASCGHCEMKS